MKILWIGMIDTGGMCWTYSNAINQYTEHECRLAIQTDTRGFDSDIVFERSMWSKPDNIKIEEKVDELIKLAEEADVLIFNAALFPGIASSYHKVASDTFDINWYGINWNDYIGKKKCFAFFLGSCSLRANYSYYVNLHKEKGFGIITCQPDIYFACKQLYERVNYIPILINNEHPRYSKPPQYSDEVLVIHSPTHRAIKNTAEFMRVCRNIKRKSSNFDFQLIERLGFHDSIRIKQNAHIGFDQMQPDEYYCLSSVENGALGLLNIVSLGEYAQRFVLDGLKVNGDGPEEGKWLIVDNEDSLYNTLRLFVDDMDFLYEKRKESYNWHHKYWNDQRLIPNFVKILEN